MPEDTDLTAAPEPAAAYTHPDKRKNLPLSGMPMKNKVKEQPKHRYEYDPHLPPVLRFDSSEASKNADQLPELLRTAQERKLSGEEVALLADALRNRGPWLEWAGKREAKACEVDPVALHIHERVSAQVLLKVAARQDVTRNLFADPEQEYREAMDFYQRDVDWSNRLILGDSLEVMVSLSKREDLAGKVQCIYMDPPYGIKYGSNFQSEVGKRDVKDGKQEDLTREPEMVKAYRDTWHLGIHSYLTYLRDRLYAAKELLADSGSIFVQISDDNLHRVRLILDEVFGPDNFVCQISIQKTGSTVGSFIQSNVDFLLWYAKDRPKAESRFRPILLARKAGGIGGSGYTRVETPSGERRTALPRDFDEDGVPLDHLKLWRSYPLTSDGFRETTTVDFHFRDSVFHPGSNRHWGVRTEHLARVGKAERLVIDGKQISLVRLWDDSPVVPLSSHWGDLGGASDRVYVVQTNVEVVKRCLLMASAPGDLVLDPTCGSGTTAFVAEQWGRRWITIDSSRVAIAIARQRLMTAKYDYYPLRKPEQGIQGGFTYKTVPHITLKSIAQNVGLDPLFESWEKVLAEKLITLNQALSGVTPELRRDLSVKLEMKRRRKDKSDPVTDADIRRWVLPEAGKVWQEWEVPFDTDPDWPEALRDALTSYRTSWRAKMDEINAAIAARAEQEELVDQPEVDKKKLRVAGPFTVEGVIPAAESLNLEDSPIGGEPEAELETFVAPEESGAIAETSNAEAYLDKMLRFMKSDGVRFSDNKVLQFTELRPLSGSTIHAEGTWGEEGEERRVGISFGPQHGPITSMQVVEVLHLAYRRGYDEIVFAGFSFDASAQATIQENQDDPDANIQAHICHIRPDASPSMSGLLKDSPKSAKPTQHNQIFTVSGLPRARVTKEPDGQFVARMEGVDIYDPVANTVYATGAEKVAAWFLDSDYDGKAFCITQAFFPDAKAWDKLSKALTGVVDPDRFAAFSGTKSLPFPVGKHKRAAVKVIDPRGNEVMKVLSLEGVNYGA